MLYRLYCSDVNLGHSGTTHLPQHQNCLVVELIRGQTPTPHGLFETYNAVAFFLHPRQIFSQRIQFDLFDSSIHTYSIRKTQ